MRVRDDLRRTPPDPWEQSSGAGGSRRWAGSSSAWRRPWSWAGGSPRPIGRDADRLQKEIEDVLARTRNPKLKLEASFARAVAVLYKIRSSESPDMAPFDAFLRLAPKDPRASRLLFEAAYFARDEKV